MNVYAVFDLDDTLLNLHVPLINMLNQRTGRDRCPKTVETFTLEEDYGIDQPTFFKWAEESMVLESGIIHDGAVDLFKTLREQDTRIAIVTARGWHPKALQVTEDWLHLNNLVPDELHIVSMQCNKNNSTTHMKKVRLAVDDREHHVFHFSKLTKNAFLYRQGWNKHATDHRHIDNLTQLNNSIIQGEI